MNSAGKPAPHARDDRLVMTFRIATCQDLELLADWNRQLIEDERHRRKMTLSNLEERMRGWIDGSYVAVIFSEPQDVAYALYREDAEGVYLRQFLVGRDWRRRGVGTRAMNILRHEVWPGSKRLTVDVLNHNLGALGFWRAMGYRDYCLTLEIDPSDRGEAEKGE